LARATTTPMARATTTPMAHATTTMAMAHATTTAMAHATTTAMAHATTTMKGENEHDVNNLRPQNEKAVSPELTNTCADVDINFSAEAKNGAEEDPASSPRDHNPLDHHAQNRGRLSFPMEEEGREENGRRTVTETGRGRSGSRETEEPMGCGEAAHKRLNEFYDFSHKLREENPELARSSNQLLKEIHGELTGQFTLEKVVLAFLNTIDRPSENSFNRLIDVIPEHFRKSVIPYRDRCSAAPTRPPPSPAPVSYSPEQFAHAFTTFAECSKGAGKGGWNHAPNNTNNWKTNNNTNNWSSKWNDNNEREKDEVDKDTEWKQNGGGGGGGAEHEKEQEEEDDEQHEGKQEGLPTQGTQHEMWGAGGMDDFLDTAA